MKPLIVLGDEAVAQAAIDAGLGAAYSYPGTPASEIMEYLRAHPGAGNVFQAHWSVNEKVAYEEALGVSFSGQRALVSMKHVGLNVAADPFMNSALTGSVGGLVVVAADDPSMHSSQNEQDSRYFADFARIFCFEPAGHQEAYDMTRQAFDLSEELDIPVMLRLVTRISHSRSAVQPREPRRPNDLKLGRPQDWTLLPVNARRRFKLLLEKQPRLVQLSNESPFNALELNPKNHGLGIIASGIAYNYVYENFAGLAERDRPSMLKVSTYPLPESLVMKLLAHVEAVLFAEEGYPFIEQRVRGLVGVPGKKLMGRMSGELPSQGELSPDVLRPALGLSPRPRHATPVPNLASRPPQLCAGCPHADALKALNAALEDSAGANVFSDIGCYTLGALPPYEAVDTCVCMGASVSMAKGGADAGVHPSVAVIGDSTFAHSGLTPLLSAARDDARMTVLILDNGTVAMTGGQESFGTGERLLRMVEGLGVAKEHIRVIVPLPKNHEANVRIFREEIAHPGLSVVIADRECLQAKKK